MTSETKACPLCGETILAVAVKCKHCGSMLGDNVENQAAPSTTAGRNLAIVIGTTIVLAFLVYGPSTCSMGETSKAEKMIAGQFGATGVHCERIGDVIGVRQWMCTARWEGTDGVPFWANADSVKMWVGMGTGQ